MIQVDATGNVSAVIDGVTASLDQAHHVPAGRPPDFRVATFQQTLAEARHLAATITRLMAAIAGMALALGGFSVMSIMLIAVADRGREIGVRRAVGAQPGDVLRQFVLEAATPAAGGGVLGLLIGFGIAATIPHVARVLAQYAAWPAPLTVVLALAVALLTGGVFGLYPAARAARLDPIEALRYE